MKTLTLLFLVMILSTASAFAQEEWTPQELADHRAQNRISVSQFREGVARFDVQFNCQFDVPARVTFKAFGLDENDVNTTTSASVVLGSGPRTTLLKLRLDRLAATNYDLKLLAYFDDSGTTGVVHTATRSTVDVADLYSTNFIAKMISVMAEANLTGPQMALVGEIVREAMARAWDQDKQDKQDAITDLTCGRVAVIEEEKIRPAP